MQFLLKACAMIAQRVVNLVTVPSFVRTALTTITIMVVWDFVLVAIRFA